MAFLLLFPAVTLNLIKLLLLLESLLLTFILIVKSIFLLLKRWYLILFFPTKVFYKDFLKWLFLLQAVWLHPLIEIKKKIKNSLTIIVCALEKGCQHVTAGLYREDLLLQFYASVFDANLDLGAVQNLHESYKCRVEFSKTETCLSHTQMWD